MAEVWRKPAGRTRSPLVGGVDEGSGPIVGLDLLKGSVRP